jgi:hypothetical protein
VNLPEIPWDEKSQCWRLPPGSEINATINGNISVIPTGGRRKHAWVPRWLFEIAWRRNWKWFYSETPVTWHLWSVHEGAVDYFESTDGMNWTRPSAKDNPVLNPSNQV